MNKSRSLIACMLILALFASATSLGACKKSRYADATQAVPTTWKTFSADNMTFRFEAGFTPADAADFSTILTQVGDAVGVASSFNTVKMWQSPARDKDTTDYLLAGYFNMPTSITAKDLEAIMPNINAISDSQNLYDQLKMLQSSQIRIYGSYEALIFTVRITKGETVLVLQFGLVPSGTRLYTFVYADFTTQADGLYMKRLLSSLTIG